jgi:predicted transcriptional regulator
MLNEENRLAVSVAEVARMIGVSRRTVEGYIGARRLASRKLGFRRVVLVRDLMKFLQSDQPSASSAKSSPKEETARTQPTSGDSK